MTFGEKLLTVAVLGAATALTRFLPFIVLGSRATSPFVRYLGTVLPASVFALLVVLCFRDVAWLEGAHGLPELLATAATVLLHLLRRNMLLSIFGGTAAYMLLVHIINGV